jgi:hypothetical protein
MSTREVILEIGEIKVSAQKYKPYELAVHGLGDRVKVYVPDEHWTKDEDGDDILTLEGVAYIAKEIADTFDEMSDQRLGETKAELKFMQTAA